MNRTLKALFFSTATMFTLSTSEPADAEPFVEVHHPPSVKQLGGQEVKKVDCSTLFRFADEPKTVLPTCEFVKQVDANSQDICGMSKNSTSAKQLIKDQIAIASRGHEALQQEYLAGKTDKATIKNALGVVTASAILHLATVHNECVERAGRMEQRAGGTPERLYGTDWQTKTHCPLVEATKACMTEMGIK